MKFVNILSLLIFICSCASNKSSSALNADGKLKIKNINQVMIYSDMSGKFSLKRTMKISKGKIMFQKMIYEEDFSKFLERSRSVTQVKLNEENEVVLLPMVAQFKGWFEGLEYSSQIKISHSSKQVQVLTQVQGKDYPKTQTFNLPPENKRLCFFHMIPECIKLWGSDKLVSAGKKVEFWFYAIMDSYPFLELIFNAIPNKWITEATLTYEGIQDKEHHFSVEIHDQAISLKYNQNWEFIGMFWISQSMTMVTN